MTTPDPFEHQDVAYVFGALDAAETAQFETHLAGCVECTARVADARGLTALLGDISEAEVVAEVPETLLPGLLRRATVSRRRQRWVTTGLAGMAAALVVALTVLIWPSATHHDNGRTIAMTALQPSPVRATVELFQTASGTQIKLHCVYQGGSSEGTVEYGLVVFDKKSNHTELSTWKLKPGEDAWFPATTALAENQISHLDITYGSQSILTAKV